MRYDKHPIDFSAQIALLKERGMIFADEDKALEGLFSISYFRLASYWRHLEHRKSRQFKADTKFDEVLTLYAFDQHLRNIIFSAIQNIEIAFRTRVSHFLSMKYGAFWFLDSALFKDAEIHQSCIEKLKEEIEGAGQGNSPAGGAMMQNGTDPVSRDIQRQIEETKKQIQELSEKQITPEEKMKKRQELQKKLTELTNQLRQHQIEQQKQKRQEKRQGNTMDDLLGGRRENPGPRGKAGAPKGRASKAGMSGAGMKALISADAAMKQADAQGSVAAGLEGRGKVLEAEIKQDSSRGIDVSDKKEELAEVVQRASDTQASQGEILGEAVKEAKEAAKAEQAKTEQSGNPKKAEEEAKNGSPAGEKEGRAVSEEEMLGNNVDLRL